LTTVLFNGALGAPKTSCLRLFGLPFQGKIFGLGDLFCGHSARHSRSVLLAA